MKTRFLCALFILLSTGLFAQERATGFEMLNNAPSAYSLSLAEATVSKPEGAASIYINPALLALNTTSSIDLGYSFWLADVSNIFGGVNFRSNQHAIAFSFYTSGASDYQQRNGAGASNGTFTIQNLSISAAYAYDFNYFSLGGAFQYLHEENFTYRASGYAFNLGIAKQFMNGRFRTGASFSNIGEMEELYIEATTLPVNFKVGASADIIEISARQNDELPILISAAADYVYPINENSSSENLDYIPADPYFNLGLTIAIAQVVELNSGYKPGNKIRPIAFGASFVADNIKFNYALVPFNTGYGTVHSIGLEYQF